MALRLALDGFDVVCCTSSDERFAALQEELLLLQQREQRQEQQQDRPGPRWQDQEQSAAVAKRARPGRGRLSRARRVDEGVHYRLWVVGKFDTSVR